MKKLTSVLRKNRLAGSAGMYVVGNILQRFSVFLFLPLWARFLDPTDYAITGTIQSYGQILTIVFLFGLNSAITRHYFDFDDDNEFKRYFSSAIIFMIVFPGFIAFSLIWQGRWIWEWISLQLPFSPYVQLQIASSYLQIFIQTWSSFLRTRQEPKKFLVLQYGTLVLNILFGVVFVVWLNMGALGVFLQYLCSYLLISIVILVAFFRSWYRSGSLRLSYVWSGIKYGLPLSIHVIALMFFGAIGKLILERNVSLTDLGLYNMAYAIGMTMSTLVGAINLAWQPYYYDLMKTNNRPQEQLFTFLRWWILVVSAICLYAILWIGEVIAWILPASYLPTAIYSPIIIYSGIWHGYYLVVSLPLFYYKKTSQIPLGTVAAILIVGFLSVVYAPEYGVHAVSWSLVIGEVFLTGYFWFLSRRYQRIPIPFFKVIVSLLFLLAAVYLGSIFPVSLVTAIVEGCIASVAVFLFYKWLFPSGGIPSDTHLHVSTTSRSS